MQELLLFLMCYIVVFLLYQIFIVRRAKKNRKSKKNRKDPVEVVYLERKYRLDMKKVNYNQLLQIIALVSSFDISVAVSLIMLINNFVLEIVVGFISVFVLIIISYHLVYLFYKKKGMIIDE